MTFWAGARDFQSRAQLHKAFVWQEAGPLSSNDLSNSPPGVSYWPRDWNWQHKMNKKSTTYWKRSAGLLSWLWKYKALYIETYKMAVEDGKVKRFLVSHLLLRLRKHRHLYFKVFLLLIVYFLWLAKFTPKSHPYVWSINCNRISNFTHFPAGKVAPPPFQWLPSCSRLIETTHAQNRC